MLSIYSNNIIIYVCACTIKLIMRLSHVTYSSGKLALSSSRHKALCTIIIDVATYAGSIRDKYSITNIIKYCLPAPRTLTLREVSGFFLYQVN